MGVCHRKYDSINDNKAVLLGCKRNDVVDWEAVKNFLRCHPVSTEENTRNSTDDDPMGRVFIVEVVARNPPVDVVKEALAVFPDALTLNVSCFFAACQCASTDVARILIQHLLQQSRDADACPYPWIVLSLVTAQGTRVLLEEYPQGVLQVANGLYCKTCPLDHMLFMGATNPKPHKVDSQWWEKVKLMLMVEEHGTVKISNQDIFHPVHAILRRVIGSRPEFFTDRREAQHVLWLLHQLQVTEPSLFQARDQNGDFPLHVILRGKCQVGPCFAATRDLIVLLLQAHPASAGYSSLDGRLPLHLALENGWPCHDLLLEAAPEALQTRDTKTGMYPFQTAACSNISWGRKQKRARTNGPPVSALDITYMLLREDPVQAARGLVEGTMNV